MTTAALVLLALSFGVCIGYVLCALMTVASDEQRRAEHQSTPVLPSLGIHHQL